MLALAPIVEQLKSGGFRHVEGVLELPSAEETGLVLPSLFVMPLVETASANAMAGRRDQAVDTGFGVLVTVDAARRNRAGVSDELKAQVDKVVDLITGWQHPEASRACDYAGGRLSGAGRTSVSWLVRFSSRFHLRKDR